MERRGLMLKNSAIVNANMRHAPAIAEIERAVFSSPWSLVQIEEELANPCARYLVCEHEGETIGYIGAQVILDEGYITNVAVTEKFRRHRVAHALVSALCEQLSDCEFLTLEVRPSNAPAIALYTSFGFKTVGLRRGYYTKPDEDALLMTKWLKKGGI
ncbi:MAG: ribosomal protein S18-alanine N-acetyltransferase [Clostridia bacterium]